jgi:transposase InsO family protein
LKERIKKIAEAVRQWITAVGAKTAYIEPGSPWENGYVESFMYRRPREAQIVIESWRRHYNAVRPHQSLGYRAPAPEAFAAQINRARKFA